MHHVTSPRLILTLPRPASQIWPPSTLPIRLRLLFRFRHASHLWPPKMNFQPLPTLSIIPFLDFPTLREPPLRHPNHQTALEHKSHAPLSYLHRRQRRVARFLVRRCVRPVRAHDVVQTCARGLETSAFLSIVMTVDQTHEFRHGVAVVPWRAERGFLDEPSGREDDEVCHGGSRGGAWCGKDGKNGWIGVVV